MSIKVLVLWGTANHGKTQTLNLVIRKLLNNYQATLVSGTLSSDIKTDCWVVLEYNGKKIGIVTNGDDKQILRAGFNSLPNNCDLYLCASRSKGGSCDFITTKFQEDEIMWMEKWSVTSSNSNFPLYYLQEKANDVQALGIIEAINIL